MAGNSQRRGARRTAGSKKGATFGSGGQRRRSLEGKGPTPPAEKRPGHPAQRAGTRRGKQPGKGGSATGGRAGAGRDRAAEAPELLVARNPVLEALRAGVPASTLYVGLGVDADDRVADAIRLAGDRGVPILEVGRGELDRMTNGALHQGIGLQVPPYGYADPDAVLARARESAHPPLVVALDGVLDPRTLGAVVRTAAAFGADGVLLPERRTAGMTAVAWRASAGAAARVPVARVTNLVRTLRACQQAGLLVVGLDADGEIALGDLEAAVDPLVLVVGSEGRGLSRLVADTCDLTVAIPMADPAASLNAAAAVAVALAHIATRRRTS